MSAGTLHAKSPLEVSPLLQGDFGERVKALKGLSFEWTVYPAARQFWNLWASESNDKDWFWLVFISPQLKLAGLAVASAQTSPSDRPYFAIDESISRDDAMVFEVSARKISFGVTPQPCFWGLYTYLRQVQSELGQIGAASDPPN